MQRNPEIMKERTIEPTLVEAGEIRCPQVVGNECMIEGGSSPDRDLWTRDPLGCVYGETIFHEMAIKHDEGNKTRVKVWRDPCSDCSCRFVLFATSLLSTVHETMVSIEPF